MRAVLIGREHGDGLAAEAIVEEAVIGEAFWVKIAEDKDALEVDWHPSVMRDEALNGKLLDSRALAQKLSLETSRDPGRSLRYSR